MLYFFSRSNDAILTTLHDLSTRNVVIYYRNALPTTCITLMQLEYLQIPQQQQQQDQQRRLKFHFKGDRWAVSRLVIASMVNLYVSHFRDV